MNTSSRFSVLNPDVNLDIAFKTKTKKQKSNLGKEDKYDVKQTKPAPKVIKKKLKEETDLLAMAFGKSKSNNKKQNTTKDNSKGKKKNKCTKNGASTSLNIDEQWKKIDEEFVEKENENALREAIIQSKLDYEENKNVTDEKKLVEIEVESLIPEKSGKGKKKKDKMITISLDQFNNLDHKELATLRDPPAIKNESNQNNFHKFDEEKFFKDVEESTKQTLEKEKRQEQFKSNFNKVNNEIQVKKFRSEIEKRDFEIQALRLEVESLRSLLGDVKTRNKKLCDVISCSEMRSKGELVIELDKMTKGRDEFSEEVTRLNCELEQERTKVSHLTNELKKIQGKKRNADASSK